MGLTLTNRTIDNFLWKIVPGKKEREGITQERTQTKACSLLSEIVRAMRSAAIGFSSLLEIAVISPLFRNEISFVYDSILAGKTPLIIASMNKRYILLMRIRLLYALILRRRRRMRLMKYKKRFWIRKVYEEREGKGEFHLLTYELRLHDSEYFLY